MPAPFDGSFDRPESLFTVYGDTSGCYATTYLCWDSWLNAVEFSACKCLFLETEEREIVRLCAVLPECSVLLKLTLTITHYTLPAFGRSGSGLWDYTHYRQHLMHKGTISLSFPFQSLSRARSKIFSKAVKTEVGAESLGSRLGGGLLLHTDMDIQQLILFRIKWAGIIFIVCSPDMVFVSNKYVNSTTGWEQFLSHTVKSHWFMAIADK